MRVPAELLTEAKNASARLGVPVWAVMAACIRKSVDSLSEEEAAAELDPQALRAFQRRRAAEKAREVLAGGTSGPGWPD